MPYPDLQNAVQHAGFTVTEFSDQRVYFGCWSLTVEAHGYTYLIVNEGRDGWLMFYRMGTAGTFTELDKKVSAWMDDSDKATQCLIWLSSYRPPLQPHKVRNYYVIAEKDLVPEQPHSADWPKLIGYCYDDDYFLFFEGKGHGLSGTAVPACGGKKAEWLKIFAALDVEWFMSWLETLKFTSEEAFTLALTKRTGSLGVRRY
ncbi:hypothetical protein [Pseudomonas umsongensis]|uniref:hypothetical protein n=1 Tax=Pseudomonas umsongensis TaxID=198618 RepID=UPI0003768AF7|nr:hypothetical protein [Pseudomonas umsongensis]